MGSGDSEGFIIGRIFASDIWGAYFREGLFLGELIIEFYGSSDIGRVDFIVFFRHIPVNKPMFHLKTRTKSHFLMKSLKFTFFRK